MAVKETAPVSEQTPDTESSVRANLSDNNQARVSICSDFIALRKAGETVKDIPDLDPPDQGLAEAALFDCYINGYVIENQLHEIKSQKPSLGEILRHRPATEKLISSDEEMKKRGKYLELSDL